MYPSKNSIGLKAIRTNSGTTDQSRPFVWTFRKEDYDTIHKEYKSIREKSTLKTKSPTTIRTEHRAFADKFPQLYMIATSPEICDKNVDMLIEMIQRAKQGGKDNMNEEAATFGKTVYDEHADPSRFNH